MFDPNCYIIVEKMIYICQINFPRQTRLQYRTTGVLVPAIGAHSITQQGHIFFRMQIGDIG
jgi:hypothetical protein